MAVSNKSGTQLIEIMQNLIPVLPWASDEINLFTKETYDLVEKYDYLKKTVEDQEYQIKYLERQNIHLTQCSDEHTMTLEELEKQIDDLEKENYEFNEEIIMSQQCMQILSEMVSKLKETNFDLKQQFEQNEQKLLNLQKEYSNYDMTQTVFSNQQFNEINHLQELLNENNEKLRNEIEQNKMLKTRIQNLKTEFNTLEDEYKDSLAKHNQKQFHCVCFDENHIQCTSDQAKKFPGDQEISQQINNENAKMEIFYTHFNTKCDHFFREFKKSVIFDIQNLNNCEQMSSNDKFSLNNSAAVSADGRNIVKCDSSTQTDSKILCYVYEEDDSIDLTIFDNNTDGYFKSITSNHRLGEMLKILRRKYPRKTKSVGVNTATLNDKSVLIQSKNVIVECAYENAKLKSKEIKKSLKTSFCQTSDNFDDLTSSQSESCITSTPLRSSTKFLSSLIKNNGNNSFIDNTDINLPSTSSTNDSIDNLARKYRKNSFRKASFAASQTFAKLKQLQTSYAQIAKKN